MTSFLDSRFVKLNCCLIPDLIESVTLVSTRVESWPGVQKVVSNEFPKLEATPFAVLDEVYYQHSVDWLNAQFHVIELIVLTIIVLGIFNTVSTSIL